MKLTKSYRRNPHRPRFMTRQTVLQHLREFGADQSEIDKIRETELRDGAQRVAVIYRAAEFIALWDVLHDNVRIYDTKLCLLAFGRRSLTSTFPQNN